MKATRTAGTGILTVLAILFSLLLAPAAANASTAVAAPESIVAVALPESVAPAAVPAALNPMVGGWCGDGRCTVTFSKYETWLIGQGRVPAVPWFVPWNLKAAYYALAYGHKWFASQYAKWGYCSGIRLDIRPWGNQGYFGYRC